MTDGCPTGGCGAPGRDPAAASLLRYGRLAQREGILRQSSAIAKNNAILERWRSDTLRSPTPPLSQDPAAVSLRRWGAIAMRDQQASRSASAPTGAAPPSGGLGFTFPEWQPGKTLYAQDFEQVPISCELRQTLWDAREASGGLNMFPRPTCVTRDCATLPGRTTLVPPDIACVGADTFDCFGGQWPAGCEDLQPCLNLGTRCALPTTQQQKLARIAHPGPLFGIRVSASIESDDGSVTENYSAFEEDPVQEKLVSNLLVAGGVTLADLDDYVATAWAFLMANIDVVQWLACMTSASPDLIPQQCSIVIRDDWDLVATLTDHIMGVVPTPVGIIGTSGPDADDAGRAAADPVAGVVTIPLWTAEPYSERIRDFSSGNANKQLCAVVELAATILHELTHFCIRQFCVENKDLGGHDDEEDRICWDEARMMGSGFKWSMGALCPSVLGPLDCCPYGDPWMFFRSAKVAGRPSCAGQDTFFRPCP